MLHALRDWVPSGGNQAVQGAAGLFAITLRTYSLQTSRRPRALMTITLLLRRRHGPRQKSVRLWTLAKSHFMRLQRMRTFFSGLALLARKAPCFWHRLSTSIVDRQCVQVTCIPIKPPRAGTSVFRVFACECAHGLETFEKGPFLRRRPTKNILAGETLIVHNGFCLHRSTGKN